MSRNTKVKSCGRLVLLNDPLLDGEYPEEILFTDGIRSFGRSLNADIHLTASKAGKYIISRMHGTISVNAAIKQVIVEDTGSLNGIFVNNVRVQTEQLHNGDIVQFGGLAEVAFGTTVDTSDVALKYRCLLDSDGHGEEKSHKSNSKRKSITTTDPLVNLMENQDALKKEDSAREENNDEIFHGKKRRKSVAKQDSLASLLATSSSDNSSQMKIKSAQDTEQHRTKHTEQMSNLESNSKIQESNKSVKTNRSSKEKVSVSNEVVEKSISLMNETTAVASNLSSSPMMVQEEDVATNNENSIDKITHLLTNELHSFKSNYNRDFQGLKDGLFHMEQLFQQSLQHYQQQSEIQNQSLQTLQKEILEKQKEIIDQETHVMNYLKEHQKEATTSTTILAGSSSLSSSSSSSTATNMKQNGQHGHHLSTATTTTASRTNDHFKGPLKTMLTCFHCKHLYIDAVVVRCSHSFCEYCFYELYDQQIIPSTSTSSAKKKRTETEISNDMSTNYILPSCPICNVSFCQLPSSSKQSDTFTSVEKNIKNYFYRCDAIDNLVWLLLEAASPEDKSIFSERVQHMHMMLQHRHAMEDENDDDDDDDDDEDEESDNNNNLEPSDIIIQREQQRRLSKAYAQEKKERERSRNTRGEKIEIICEYCGELGHEDKECPHKDEVETEDEDI
jgi:hypothetical protein